MLLSQHPYTIQTLNRYIGIVLLDQDMLFHL